MGGIGGHFPGARPDRSHAAVPFGMRGDQILASPEHAQHRLRHRLGGGRPAAWDVAFKQFWHEVAPEGPPVWPPREGRANWLWLTDLPRGGRGLDLGSPFAEIASEFAHWFERVEYLCHDGEHRRVSAVRLERSEPLGRFGVVADSDSSEVPDGAGLDCIAQIRSLGWRARTPPALQDSGSLAAWAHARLRKGGWFVFGGRNPYALRQSSGLRNARSRPIQWLRYRRLVLALQRAGFDEIRPYHALPSVWNPDAIVPYRWRAVRAFRAVTEHRSPGFLDLRSRMHPFLSSDFLLMARR